MDYVLQIFLPKIVYIADKIHLNIEQFTLYLNCEVMTPQSGKQVLRRGFFLVINE